MFLLDEIKNFSLEFIQNLTQEQIDNMVKLYGHTEIYFLIYIYR